MKVWEFFEEMDIIVYVADMETYELVYLNKKAREVYGIKSLDALKGHSCHEVLHRNSQPCAICNNVMLTEGKFRKWQYFNPILEKYLSVQCTMAVQDGRRYRVDLEVESKMLEPETAMYQKQIDMERMTNEGIRMAVQAGTPEESINIALEYIGKTLKAERTYIFERNSKGNDDNTFEWVAHGVEPAIHLLQDLPAEVCANWYDNFSEGNNIIIKSLEDIKESDPLQYENLKRQDIETLAVVPLYNQDEVIGFYGVDNPPAELLDYSTNMLSIMGYFIVSSLRRRALLKRLEQMSYHDQLTGLGNRYAMNEYAEGITQGESVGIVYCDITGLKQVNDAHGHSAGDQLILQACDCLKQVFGKYGCFRLGGDELLVLCAGITEQAFKEQVEKLHEIMEQKGVAMAVGNLWKSDENMWKEYGHVDIDSLLSVAEKKMYVDKAAYYKKKGIDRRQ